MITLFDPPDFFEERMTCCVATAIVGSAVVGAGASIAGSRAQSKATSKASKAQQDAQKYAADIQKEMYDTTRGDLQPYNTAGQDATNQLMALITDQKQPVYNPVVMDQAALEKTPGYQFNLSQGLKSAQNSAAARGLGSSGAALKGAANFATGLADSTYQNQFNNATTNALNVYNSQVAGQTNAYNRLMGVSQLGENAAAQTGAYGTQTGANIGNQAVQTAGNIGNNLIQGGNAQAAGYTGAANSLTNGVNNWMGYDYLKSSGMYGK